MVSMDAVLALDFSVPRCRPLCLACSPCRPHRTATSGRGSCPRLACRLHSSGSPKRSCAASVRPAASFPRRPCRRSSPLAPCGAPHQQNIVWLRDAEAPGWCRCVSCTQAHAQAHAHTKRRHCVAKRTHLVVLRNTARPNRFSSAHADRDPLAHA